MNLSIESWELPRTQNISNISIVPCSMTSMTVQGFQAPRNSSGCGLKLKIWNAAQSSSAFYSLLDPDGLKNWCFLGSAGSAAPSAPPWAPSNWSRSAFLPQFASDQWRQSVEISGAIWFKKLEKNRIETESTTAFGVGLAAACQGLCMPSCNQWNLRLISLKKSAEYIL